MDQGSSTRRRGWRVVATVGIGTFALLAAAGLAGAVGSGEPVVMRVAGDEGAVTTQPDGASTTGPTSASDPVSSSTTIEPTTTSGPTTTTEPTMNGSTTTTSGPTTTSAPTTATTDSTTTTGPTTTSSPQPSPPDPGPTTPAEVPDAIPPAGPIGRQVSGTHSGTGLRVEPDPGDCPVFAHRIDGDFTLASGERWVYDADYCGTVDANSLWQGEGTFTLTTPAGDVLSGWFTSQAVLPTDGEPYDLTVTDGTGTWDGAEGTCALTNHIRELRPGFIEQAGEFTCDLSVSPAAAAEPEQPATAPIEP